MRQSGKSREQIAEELNCVYGLSVSVHILNNWTADSKRARRVPAMMVAPLCAVLCEDSLQRILLSEEQLGNLELGECVARWLDRRVASPKIGGGGGKVQRKLGRSAAASANRP